MKGAWLICLAILAQDPGCSRVVLYWAMIHVYDALSGEVVTSLDSANYSKVGAVRRHLASLNGHSLHRQRLLSGGHLLADEDAVVEEMQVVVLHYHPSEMAKFLPACRSNDLSTVTAMLRMPQDPNMADERGYTGLHYATWGGHEGVVHELLEARADVQGANVNGWAALHFACGGEQPLHLVQMLLAGRADPNRPDQEGQTAMFLAVMRNHLDLVRVLAEARANPNAADGEHQTALHLAARDGNDELVECLLGAKADVNAEDQHGETPIEWARDLGHDALASMLAGLESE